MHQISGNSVISDQKHKNMQRQKQTLELQSSLGDLTLTEEKRCSHFGRQHQGNQ